MGRLIEDRRAVRPAPLEPESLLYVRPIPFERDEGGDVATLRETGWSHVQGQSWSSGAPCNHAPAHTVASSITVKHSPRLPHSVRASSSLAVPPTFPMNSRSPWL